MKFNSLASASIVVLLAFAVQVNAQRTNWVDVAHRLGGSGRSSDGSYVRLVESDGWGKGKTPPTWIAFEPAGRVAPIRGSIPVLRKVAAKAKATLLKHLPEESVVRISDTIGKSSSRVSMRFQTRGTPRFVAAKIRSAIMAIEPSALKRVRGSGVIKKDSMECEEFWTLKTDRGEFFEIKKLPVQYQKVGIRLDFHLERASGRPGQFSYFGGLSRWTGNAKAISLKPAVAPTSRNLANALSAPKWAKLCEKHARALLSQGEPTKNELFTGLADGFNNINDPGFHVCPECRRPLAKHRLFKDSAHDEVLATLHSCAHEQSYYFSRSGQMFGPIYPNSKKEMKK